MEFRLEELSERIQNSLILLVMSKLFVTGSLGFIGRNLVLKLKELGHEVYEHDIRYGSLTIPNALDVYFGKGIDHVFHLAARTFIPQSWDDPSHFIGTNVIGTQHVLEYCRKNNASLTFVSAYLYGAPPALPVKEDSDIKPENPFEISKFLAEQLCRFYSEKFDLNVNIFRPFNVYGPWQNERFLIPMVVRQVLGNEDVIRVKNLSTKRDYVYIDDLISAFTASIDHANGCNVFNIGSGNSISVKEVIDAIQKAAGTSKKVVSDENVRPNEIKEKVADISKAKEILNWSPKTSFSDGIRKIINVYQEQTV